MKKKRSPHQPAGKGGSRQRDEASGASSVEVWQCLVSQLPSREYLPATELVQQGTSANKVYLINQGLVKLTRLEKGGQEVIVGWRTPGWLLGAASVVLQEPYPVTATTLTRCELRLIPAEDFRHWLKTSEPLSWYLHQMHSREVYDWVAHVSGLAGLSARQRLEQLLRQLKQAGVLVQGKAERLQLPISQSEIARLIAVTPQYLSRLLKELEAEGLIERAQGGRRILLSKKLE